MMWLEVGEHAVQTGDRVVALVDDEKAEGMVLITPEQWVGEPPPASGRILEMRQIPPVNAETDLPLADLPPLGVRARAGEVHGIITAIDPLARTATIAVAGGADITVPAASVRIEPDDP